MKTKQGFVVSVDMQPQNGSIVPAGGIASMATNELTIGLVFVSAIASIIGTALIILSWIVDGATRCRFSRRLVLYLSLSDLMSSAAFVYSTTTLRMNPIKPSLTGCIVQACVSQLATLKHHAPTALLFVRSRVPHARARLL